MNKPSFLSVCMSPTLQKTLVFPNLVIDTVNRTKDYRLDVAGKGINVCRVLTQLGKDCRHLTQLGGILRPLFLELCSRDSLNIEWVESYSPIRFCYTLLDQGENSISELVEESEKVEEGTESRLIEAFSKLISECTVLVIAGSKAAGFTDTLIPQMVRKAREAGCLVILDIRGQDLLNSLPFTPDIIKPNFDEFVSTLVPDIQSRNNAKEKIAETWAKLYEKYHCRLVLTRGADPIWYAENGELSEYSFEPVKPLNTTGSGDAFTAGLAAAFGSGASLKEAVAEGARCGALNAGLLRPGVIH